MLNWKNLNIKNIDPASLPDSIIQTALEKLKEHCNEQNIDIKELVSNAENIKPASEEIHNRLSFTQRKLISASTIEELLTKNLAFIQTKVDESLVADKKTENTLKSINDLDFL